MRIYLDSCALNRLFDDRTQTRVRLEAEAIEDFFSLFAQRKVDWIASEVVEHEMRNNRNQVVQNDTLQLLAICSERVCVSTDGHSSVEKTWSELATVHSTRCILHAPKLPRSIFYSPPMIGSRGKRSVGSEILPQESSSR